MLQTIKKSALPLAKVVLPLLFAFQSSNSYSQTKPQPNPSIKLNTSERDAAVKEFNKLIKPKPISSREIFPELPPSSLCSKDKLVGIWKLLMVYEQPSGSEIDVFFDSPLQYLVFEPDSLYGEYKGILHNITLKDMRERVLNNSNRSQQFTVSNSGMLFFYKNGISYDSLACFFVEALKPPFRQGQLLIMPPEKSAGGKRLLKVYEKVFIEFEAPYFPPVASPSKLK